MNNFDEAHSDFDWAIKIQPANPKFFHCKGLAYESEASNREKFLIENRPKPTLDQFGYPV